MCLPVNIQHNKVKGPSLYDYLPIDGYRKIDLRFSQGN